MKKIILLFLLQIPILAENVLFETGTSFLIVLKDISSQNISFIKESLVKSDGTLCYIDFDNKKYDFEKDIDDSECKKYKVKNKKVLDILNPVKFSLMFFPFSEKLKPFPIPRTLPDDVSNFLYYYGIIENKVEKIHKTYTILNNTVEIEVGGRGMTSRGTCSLVPFIQLNLVVNGITFLKKARLAGCDDTVNIDKIELNFLAHNMVLDLSYNAEQYNVEDIKKITIPFEYFKNNSIDLLNIELLRDIVYKYDKVQYKKFLERDRIILDKYYE